MAIIEKWFHMLLLQILDATKCRVYQAALKTIDTRTHIHTFVWKRHPSLLVPFFAPPRRLQNGRHHSSFLHVCHDDWSMEDSKSMRMSVPWVVKVWSCFIWRSNGDESDAMNKIHFGVPHFGISRATYEHTWTYKRKITKYDDRWCQGVVWAYGELNKK